MTECRPLGYDEGTLEMEFKSIKFEREEGWAFIRLCSAATGNALTYPLARELAEVCDALYQDEGLRVAVLCGSPGVFCTGGDSSGVEAVEALARLEIPVIAAISGPALGLGLALALSCDLRIAAPEATFGVPDIKIPLAGLSQRLPRIVGRGKALELLLLGETVGAAEAHRIGLINKIAADPEAEAREWARTLSSKAPIALRFAKEAVYKGMDLTLEQGLRLEADLYFLLHTTRDRTEGIRAFLEKRQPEFKGE